MTNRNEEVKKAMIKKALKENPNNFELQSIISAINFSEVLGEKTKQELSKEAGQKILEQDPDNQDLCFLISQVLPLREEVGRKLLERWMNIKELCCIIKHVDSLREEAWKKFLESIESKLFEIITWVDLSRESATETQQKIREEAMKILESLGGDEAIKRLQQLTKRALEIQEELTTMVDMERWLKEK